VCAHVDAALDPSYIGESGLFLINVPPEVGQSRSVRFEMLGSRNDRHHMQQLTEPDLVAWFRAVMVSNNPLVKELLEVGDGPSIMICLFLEGKYIPCVAYPHRKFACAKSSWSVQNSL
jgi:hypothetical protein